MADSSRELAAVCLWVAVHSRAAYILVYPESGTFNNLRQTILTSSRALGAGGGVGGGNPLLGSNAEALMAVFHARADECREKRMRRQRLGLEFRMELAADEPRMVRHLDDFDVLAIRRAAGDAETGVGQRLFVFAIEFVAVAVPLGNFGGAVSASREESGSILHGHAPRRIVPPISSTPSSSRNL